MTQASTRAHIAARLGFWVDRGALSRLPSPWQLRAGWLVMLPITLAESERERAESRRTWLGQVPIRVPLQIAYNPRQLIVDTGLSQTPAQIVRHLLCVYHEDAFLGYDLQLLCSHPGGLSLLANEASRVVSGQTRWAPLLRRLVGGAGYHDRLIHHAERASRLEFPDIRDLDPRFSSLIGFATYCLSFPDWPEAGFYRMDPARVDGSGW